jgi:hypothetical protein
MTGGMGMGVTVLMQGRSRTSTVSPMDDLGGRLVDALTALENVADAVTPEDALRLLDDASLQVFWRDWPNLSSWAGAIWRRLNDELAGPATPPRDDDLDEVGGGG